MIKTQDLIEKYQNYSDEELMNIYEQIDDYSDEAKEALMFVINKNGGLNGLNERLNKENEKDELISKINKQIIELINDGNRASEIKNKIQYDYISETEIDELITKNINRIQEEKSDREIKPRTIFGGIIGGVIGGTIGGIIWGIQMIYSGHMLYIFGIGLVLLSYAFIRLFTKQSKKNIIVILITIISVIYALGLGQIIYELVGYQGQ